MNETGKIISLTERMREASKKSHEKSDRLVNLKLAIVLTSPKLYGESISLFAPIYKKLECIFSMWKTMKDPRHKEIFEKLESIMPHLSRSSGFESDLSFYLSSSERVELKGRINKEGHPVKDYIEHLHDLGSSDPTRLLAYFYHLYMAIFAGGYIIQKMVRKTLGLPKESNEGLLVFGINHPDKLSGKAIRSQLKKIIDEDVFRLLNDKEIQGILEESILLFDMNNKVVLTVKETETFRKISNRYVRKALVAGVVAYCSLKIVEKVFSKLRS